jgi:hypothetical protein
MQRKDSEKEVVCKQEVPDGWMKQEMTAAGMFAAKARCSRVVR